MIDMFVYNMCSYCLNNNCNQKVEIIETKNCTTYKCNEYVKDKKKIIPYQEPLVVTAERSYVIKKEI